MIATKAKGKKCMTNSKIKKIQKMILKKMFAKVVFCPKDVKSCQKVVKNLLEFCQKVGLKLTKS
jgi:hypothetical protein